VTEVTKFYINNMTDDTNQMLHE